MQQPLFSVIVPAYNRAHLIEPTLASVVAQACADWECIVVDDGSADGNALRVAVAGMADARFRYLRRDNGGGGAARNSGIDAARGRFVAFLDSDDLFLPDKLSTMAAALADAPDTAFYAPVLVDRGVGRHWIKPSRGLGPYEDVGDYLFVHNEVIQTSSLVLSRVAASRVRFDPTLRKGQDLDFCLRLQRDGVAIRMLDRPLTIWTDRGEAGRTSRTPGYRAPLAWLDRIGPLLSTRARRGYRATVLAYYMARYRPLTAAYDLARGWGVGVPARVVARHALRAYLPRDTYRWLVDRVVDRRGVEASTR